LKPASKKEKGRTTKQNRKRTKTTHMPKTKEQGGMPHHQHGRPAKQREDGPKYHEEEQ
jgi:hypothetical protein